MYIQITNRCNMLCRHCCFSCTETGIDITTEAFEAALKWAEERKDWITIGGGEPTVHPDFEHLLHRAIEVLSNQPGIITNGKNRAMAMLVADLGEKFKISASLSQDSYHEAIDPDVVARFTRLGTPLTTTSGDDPYAYGRAKSIAEARPLYCLGGHPFVRPTGEIQQCCCPNSKLIGNVFEPPEVYVPFCGCDAA